jgi:hypothetical protein
MRAWCLRVGTVSAALALLAVIAACGSDKKKAKDPTDDRKNESASSSSGTDEPPKWEGAGPAPEPKKQGGSSSGGVNEQPAGPRKDQYDKEATETVIKRAARQVKDNCGAAKDDNGKATGPWGKATIMLQLGHNGHSKGINVPEPYKGKPVGNCVEKAFTNLTFPPWQGGDTEVSWEVELVEPGKAAPAPAKGKDGGT